MAELILGYLGGPRNTGVLKKGKEGGSDRVSEGGVRMKQRRDRSRDRVDPETETGWVVGSGRVTEGVGGLGPPRECTQDRSELKKIFHFILNKKRNRQYSRNSENNVIATENFTEII